jgi:uncharacterized protein YbjQ (UPF0145 family)
MASNIITTTTNTIDGATIKKYIDVISTNVVIGTNIFSDIGASFSDFFGGLSNNYSGKLKQIYSIAINDLKNIAVKRNADAIIGISVDFDEISGQGKSMFMISATGTAVKLDNISGSDNSITKAGDVSNYLVKDLLIRQSLINKCKGELSITEEEWDYLIENPISEVLSFLVKSYAIIIKNNNESNQAKLLLKNINQLLQNSDRNKVIEVLYDSFILSSSPAYKLLKQGNFFSPHKTLDYLNKRKFTLASLSVEVDAPFYNDDDLAKMKEIVNTIDNLESKGQIISKKTMLGKSKDVYICPNGHESSPDVAFCSKTDCGQNIKGLTERQVGRFNHFAKKVDIISSLM